MPAQRKYADTPEGMALRAQARREARRRWNVKNRGRMRELHTKYRRADPQKFYDRYHDWYRRNRERILEGLRQKRIANGERLRYLGRLNENRRRGRLAASEEHFTNAEWKALCRHHRGRCAYCGARPKVLTVDHRTSLSRGGSDSIRNILPACSRCNTRKKARTEAEFRALLGVVLPAGVVADARLVPADV